MKILRLTLILLFNLWANVAFANVERFALIVGNNTGNGNDFPLRYAESDAVKFAQILRELGGFEPINTVLLTNEDANVVRSTLIALNDRIRTAQSLAGNEVVLLVYYSGHADGQSLHLGRSNFEFRELAQLVRGSAAQFRLLIVDACRSGVLTRNKGGRIIAPFELTEPNLGEEGFAFLTASSANEDAQESDEIRGSFFTHAFISGLLGAADQNGDGNVVLEEAYSYAYDATLRATSRTFGGVQHPSFRFETKGQGALTLTRPIQAKAFRAQLVFPKGTSFLVMSGSEQGFVIGEVGANGIPRSLSLAPGRYFVRGRASDHLEEGYIHLDGGQRREIESNDLERIEFARLVRKGSALQRFAQSIESGVILRPSLSGVLPDCWGGGFSYRLVLESISLRSQLDYCAGGYSNENIATQNKEFFPRD